MRYAIRKKSGRYAHARLGLKDECVCPLCRRPVHLRGGKRKAPYFAHGLTPVGKIRRCHARDRNVLELLVKDFNKKK